MSKKCDVSGKKVMYGNNVSHSNRKTSRTFLPNLNNQALYSEILKKKFYFKISSSCLRTINKYGGLDNYLLKAKNSKLTDEVKKVKKILLKVKAQTTT